MQEYFTAAIILDREDNGDLDSRVSLFTEKFGKLVAKAKSSRKITSKLAGHLQPGNLVQARLVEKNGLQVVDTLKKRKLDIRPANFYLLNKILAENESEPVIWEKLAEEKFDWLSALKILGWDSAGASCVICGRKPSCFYIKEQNFFCTDCAFKLPKDELIYL